MEIPGRLRVPDKLGVTDKMGLKMGTWQTKRIPSGGKLEVPDRLDYLAN
jgi:hypothetical protein